MTDRLHGPRPEPCATCPYRLDVPAGVWAASEYDKLPAYDLPTGEQPIGVFMCHQADGLVCAGWAAVHGDRDNLALRLTVVFDKDIDVQAVIDYCSPVPLFDTGAEAAAHGLSGIENPGDDAREAVAKLTMIRERVRCGATAWPYTENNICVLTKGHEKRGLKDHRDAKGRRFGVVYYTEEE